MNKNARPASRDLVIHRATRDRLDRDPGVRHLRPGLCQAQGMHVALTSTTPAEADRIFQALADGGRRAPIRRRSSRFASAPSSTRFGTPGWFVAKKPIEAGRSPNGHAANLPAFSACRRPFARRAWALDHPAFLNETVPGGGRAPPGAASWAHESCGDDQLQRQQLAVVRSVALAAYSWAALSGCGLYRPVAGNARDRPRSAVRA